MKVSVIIPVFNAGAYLERSIGSMLAQTMSPDEFEVVAVDDGSTDESPRRLDAIAHDHPQFHVIHTPNSGWPGRPRNIGIDAARGEFIQLLDQDDWMASDALARLYEQGQRNDADIVIGKVASNFRPVPQSVFRHTRAACTLWDAPLINSLTPHKMFRSAFLRSNGIRFPEGRRRLEDQQFMVSAYLAARSVSILADQAYYFYAGRDDAKNAGSQRIVPESYYANLREVMEVAINGTEPGAARNQLLRRFWKFEMLSRLSEPGYPDYAPDYQIAMFNAVRRLASDLVPREVDLDLGPVLNARATLVRGNQPAALASLASRMRDVKVEATARSWGWSTGRLVADLNLRFTVGSGRPMTLVRRADDLLLEPGLTDGIIDPIVLTEPLMWRAEVSVRHPETGEDWMLPQRDVRVDLLPLPTDPAVLVAQLMTTATLDPIHIAGGHALPGGRWRLIARLVGPGLDRPASVDGSGLPSPPLPALLGNPPRAYIPVRDDDGTLGIDVDRTTATLAASTNRQLIVALPQERSRILLLLPIVMRRRTPSVAVGVSLAGHNAEHSVPASLVPHDIGVQRAVLTIRPPGTPLPQGRYPAAVRLDGADGPDIPIGTIAVDGRGHLSLEGGRRMSSLALAARILRRTARDQALALGRRLPARTKRWLRKTYRAFGGSGGRRQS